MNIDEKEDSCCLYIILLLGDSYVGKSCLLLRYCDDSFQDIHSETIGLDFRLKTINLDNNEKIKAQIQDTAGQDRFRDITKKYYRGASGILLIIDVTDISSFEHIRNWIEQIKEEAPEQIIIGNINDNQNNRIVTNEDAKKQLKNLS